jgi:hypothetical protein
MKKIIILLIFMSFYSFGFSQKKSPSERATKLVNSLEKDFNLSPAQKEKLKVFSTNTLKELDKLEKINISPKTENQVAEEVNEAIDITEKEIVTLTETESDTLEKKPIEVKTYKEKSSPNKTTTRKQNSKPVKKTAPIKKK